MFIVVLFKLIGVVVARASLFGRSWRIGSTSSHYTEKL